MRAAHGSKRLGHIMLFLLAILTTACSNPGPASYTLSGTISIQEHTFVDIDINDSYAPSQYHGDNDSYTSAQQIQNPAKVGGYANVQYGGPSGDSYSEGDTDDYYKVTLAENENINLYIANVFEGDLDLYLYAVSAPTTVVASSTLTTSVETVTVPAAASGDYYIRVMAASGGSNYLLTVGNVGISSLFEQSLIYDNFVPNELIVRFKNHNETQINNFINNTGLSVYRNSNQKSALINFSSPAQKDKAFSRLGIETNANNNVKPNKSVHANNGKKLTVEQQAKQDTLKLYYALKQRDDIESVDVNYIRTATALPTDTLYDRMWNLPAINMPTVWENSSYTGNGVTVAVIDTGILQSHPDLSSQLSSDGGYDFISSTLNEIDGTGGIDNNPEDPGDNSGTGYPSSFHGTHVSGTIAAAANGTGVVGVAHGARIMPLRVLGKYGGTDYDIIQAMYYAARISNDSGTTPTTRADIINMSLGGPGYSSSFQDAVNSVRTAGLIIVAAAGNESSSTKSYPAAYSGVIAVSAVDQNNNLAWYSNYGQPADNWIDIAAPGGDTRTDNDGDGNPDGILSTLGDDSGGSIVMTYDYYQGTSMASPHVAGIIALMAEAYASANGGALLPPSQLDAWLPNIIDDLGATGNDIYFGHGLINAAKAVAIADGSSIFPAAISLNSQSVTFTPSMTGLDITVGNSGTETMILDSVSENSGGWLSVVASDVDSNNLGRYHLSVDRTGLSDGEYTASVTFGSSTPGVSDVILTVSMKVGFVGSEDAGYHYLVVVDAKTGYGMAYLELLPSGGVYTYSVSNIPPGSYYIFAGTDMDNDWYFCNEGEACGTYDTVPLQVDRNLTGLNFITGFRIPYSPAQAGAQAQAYPGFRKQ